MGHNACPVPETTPQADYGDERDQDAFWEAVRPADEPLRHRWFLPAVALILALSVPWYLPSSVGGRLVGGLPVWTWITVACALMLAMVTAYASLRLWRDGGDAAGGDDEPGAGGADAGDST